MLPESGTCRRGEPQLRRDTWLQHRCKKNAEEIIRFAIDSNDNGKVLDMRIAMN
jgi:hypothetical protein